MTLADVNILLAAFRHDHESHVRCRTWLERERASGPFGVAPLALSGVLRIASNRRIYPVPTAIEDTLGFAEALLEDVNAVVVNPGAQHWSIFAELLRKTQVRGNDVPDAWFAALAIESGCTWVTMDQGFKRFPGLSVRTP